MPLLLSSIMSHVKKNPPVFLSIDFNLRNVVDLTFLKFLFIRHTLLLLYTRYMHQQGDHIHNSLDEWFFYFAGEIYWCSITIISDQILFEEIGEWMRMYLYYSSVNFSRKLEKSFIEWVMDVAALQVHTPSICLQ